MVVDNINFEYAYLNFLKGLKNVEKEIEIWLTQQAKSGRFEEMIIEIGDIVIECKLVLDTLQRDLPSKERALKRQQG